MSKIEVLSKRRKVERVNAFLNNTLLMFSFGSLLLAMLFGLFGFFYP